ncbi:hypothetical protein J421_5045 (plasmid) [Gemmatirosa kalamazoonensis]|uniref:Uncharacterized protein n=1 Tax=Gemmatirosa kalamazoonensis TaxID=861299 RepID=W0RQF0_9BACT|nr:hypothetical protein [Gemmatirosa kalamazoonensis]AHG92580.1 hypothetical protein J421_5045 [Gemmatirosa kalamazoonensis]
MSIALITRAPSAEDAGIAPTSSERGSEVAERCLRRLDTAMARPSPETAAALRAAVTDLVDEMRARGLSRDQVVGAVTALAREHTLGSGVLRLSGRTPSTASSPAAFDARLAQWCTRAYCDDAWW